MKEGLNIEFTKLKSKLLKILPLKMMCMKGLILNYRRGRHTQNVNQVLVKVEGVYTKEDAEKIVDIIFEDENVETFRNEVKQLVEEAFSDIKNVSNKKVLPLIEILIKGMIEDL